MSATSTPSHLSRSNLRLRGVVERIAPTSHPSGHPSGGATQSILLRDLAQTSDGRPVSPDSAWFDLTPAWLQAGVQPGDTVQFTTSPRYVIETSRASTQASLYRAVRRLIKGLDPRAEEVTVIRRPQPRKVIQTVVPLQDALAQQQRRLEEMLAANQELEAEQQALMHEQEELREQAERLQRQLAEQTARQHQHGQRQRKRLVLITSITALVATLGGGAIGWSTAQRHLPQGTEQALDPAAR